MYSMTRKNREKTPFTVGFPNFWRRKVYENIRETDTAIFSDGKSTGGFATVRYVHERENSLRCEFDTKLQSIWDEIKELRKDASRRDWAVIAILLSILGSIIVGIILFCMQTEGGII